MFSKKIHDHDSMTPEEMEECRSFVKRHHVPGRTLPNGKKYLAIFDVDLYSLSDTERLVVECCRLSYLPINGYESVLRIEQIKNLVSPYDFFKYRLMHTCLYSEEEVAALWRENWIILRWIDYSIGSEHLKRLRRGSKQEQKERFRQLIRKLLRRS